MTGTVKVYVQRFTEDEIAVRDEDGDIVEYADPPCDDEHVHVEEYDDLTAVEAAERIVREGLSFAATGSDWAADPDGSYISDYATGERTAKTAHLSGFHPRVVAAIIERVG